MLAGKGPPPRCERPPPTAGSAGRVTAPLRRSGGGGAAGAWARRPASLSRRRGTAGQVRPGSLRRSPVSPPAGPRFVVNKRPDSQTRSAGPVHSPSEGPGRRPAWALPGNGAAPSLSGRARAAEALCEGRALLDDALRLDQVRLQRLPRRGAVSAPRARMRLCRPRCRQSRRAVGPIPPPPQRGTSQDKGQGEFSGLGRGQDVRWGRGRGT